MKSMPLSKPDSAGRRLQQVCTFIHHHAGEQGVIKTITSDNGTQFACHEVVSRKLGINFYFAHPYHSWERGSNENTNGLARQYIPKGTNFDNITEEFLEHVEIMLNSRPRRRHGYKTLDEMFNKCPSFIAAGFELCSFRQGCG